VASMNDTLIDSVLFYFASPILLFQFARRARERYRFFRLAMELRCSANVVRADLACRSVAMFVQLHL